MTDREARDLCGSYLRGAVDEFCVEIIKRKFKGDSWQEIAAWIRKQEKLATQGRGR